MKCRAFSLWWVLIAVFALLVLFIIVVPVITSDHIPSIIVKQKAWLHTLDAAVELFSNESSAYPPSDANDPTGRPYCGTMKLTEALLGQDLLGFHPKSAFRCDGLNATGTADLYPGGAGSENLKVRVGPYVASENANAFRLADIYGKGNTGPFPEDTYVLCDTYERAQPSGKKTGMPILYYRANHRGTSHRLGDPNNIYNSADNQALISLGVPGRPDMTHPLVDPNQFYEATQDDRVATPIHPFRKDLFILISAGRDGLYGTADDAYNFEPSLRRR